MPKLKKLKSLGAVAVLVVLLVAVVASSKLIRQRIFTRPRAADINAQIAFSSSFVNSTAAVNTATSFDVPVFVKTDTASVRGVDMVINFNRSLLTLVSITPDPLNTTTLDTYAPVDTNGNFDMARVVNAANSSGIIDFGGVTFNWGTNQVTTAFSGTAQVATLRFTAGSTPTGATPTDIAFSATAGNTTDTNIVAENPVRDVISSPSTQAFKMSVTINSAVTPTPTLTPTPIPPTPTRTPTPTASPTPVVPTPTTAPATGTMDFKVRFQGINSSSLRLSKMVKVIFRQGTTDVFTFTNVNMTSDANGIYNGTIANINPGNYDILIKGPIHLQKKVTSSPITITSAGPNSFDWSANYLPAGDYDTVNNPNSIQLSDITAARGQWITLNTAVTPSNQLYDHDENGFISLSDITVILSNWTDPTGITWGDR